MIGVVVFAVLWISFSGDAVGAGEERRNILLPDRACRDLVAADYEAGVDVRGKAVVGATLGETATPPPPPMIDIPVSVDLARRLGWTREGLDAAASQGRLTLRDGVLYWNGTRLGDDARIRLGGACRDQQGRPPDESPTGETAGQVTDQAESANSEDPAPPSRAVPE